MDFGTKRQVTRVWQKWRFSAPQTHLWLIKVWFSASTFVVKIATFAKPENVRRHCSRTAKPTAKLAIIEIKIVNLEINKIGKDDSGKDIKPNSSYSKIC